jgi:hypothetical protein
VRLRRLRPRGSWRLCVTGGAPALRVSAVRVGRLRMATSRPRKSCSSSRRRRLVRSAAAVADRRVSVPRRRWRSAGSSGTWLYYRCLLRVVLLVFGLINRSGTFSQKRKEINTVLLSAIPLCLHL